MQPVCGIGHVVSNHMDHLVVIFDAAPHLHQPRAHHHLALLLLEIGPDHEIDDPGLILERDEAHPLALPGRWRISTTPATCTIERNLRAQVAGAHEAACAEIGAQEGHRMCLQTEAGGLVIGHHLLGQRHGGEAQAGPLRPLLAHPGGAEQREIGGGDEAPRIPQRLPPREAQ